MVNNDNQYKDDRWDKHYPVPKNTTKLPKPPRKKETMNEQNNSEKADLTTSICLAIIMITLTVHLIHGILHII